MSLVSLIKRYQMELAIFILALGVRLLYFWYVGVQTGSDTVRYLAGGEEIGRVLTGELPLSQITQPFYFLLYPIFLAVFQLNLPLIVVAQIIVQSLVAVALFTIGRHLFNKISGIAAAIIYCFYWEVFRWDTFILTDSLFSAMLVFSVLFYVLAETYKQRSLWILFSLSVLATAMSRPTSLPFLLAVVALATWRWRHLSRLFLILLLVTIGTSLLYLIWRYGSHEGRGINYYLDYYVMLYREGVVIRGRTTYDVVVFWTQGLTLTNLINFVNIVVRRLVAFWLPFVPAYSFGHKLLSFALLMPIYLLALYNLYRWRKTGMTRTLGFLFTIILYFWLFQGVTEVDFDWRYRAPILPILILVAVGILYQDDPTTVKKFALSQK